MRFLDDGHRFYDPGIFEDRCITLSMTDDSWPEEFLATIRVGAIGWLLSCRQAYVEGIEILYSTNTFHILSPYLSAHLPSFILPQRLSRIRKVEFAWEWGMFTPQRDEETFERQLASILSKLPVELPRLTSLKIAFQDNIGAYACMHTCPSRGEFAPWLEGKVLVPLDALVQALPVLEECEVYFTASIHWFLGKEAALDESERGRFWRGAGGGGERGRGYWVCEGRDDTPRPVCGIAFN
ncbi:hypothetical protein M409DRAFT_18559 [Zasmidium cellare ATCC 36951]|uniref:DUF7730 domain-containing protein n=1 Tax=Zasmidium cellare ATCC 36951 TaxID=1080233 RepID=A0A6A6CZW6_ZASCE|nr:uncharacterized protein M409DRAFT_18559 [Zasmidium cellare ATCC 36951]KAF2171442.1 hypothetical protein M409DRAFT_18559 [Zasmidium cellare ATCC 36951]